MHFLQPLRSGYNKVRHQRYLIPLRRRRDKRQIIIGLNDLKTAAGISVFIIFLDYKREIL